MASEFWDEPEPESAKRYDGSICYFPGSHMGAGNVCRQCFWTYRQLLHNAEKALATAAREAAEGMRERSARMARFFSTEASDQIHALPIEEDEGAE